MGIYTDKAESALKKAQRFSARMHHPYTGTEHILMGLLDEPDSTAGQVLAGSRSDTEGTGGDDRPADSPGRNGPDGGTERIYAESPQDTG